MVASSSKVHDQIPDDHKAASSQTSSSTDYHVFLSYTNQDTENNFVDRLYKSLVDVGIHTYSHHHEENLKRNRIKFYHLRKLILNSIKVYIIVLSKTYGFSRACLDDLVEIMKRREGGGMFVIPFFFDVDPAHVRKQTGPFAEAFEGHKRDLLQVDDKLERLQEWGRALKEIADLGGFIFRQRQESKIIQQIVEDVTNKLNKKALYVAPYLVGTRVLVTCINYWIEDRPNEVGIATISGTGGVGKTTIAKIVYNHNFDKFEGSSFLANVREASEQPDGMLRLQRQLLSEIRRKKEGKIYNVDEGIMKIRETICCKRVLVVLDDVDELDQLNAIVGMREWFYPGSKILITTRHEHLLRIPNYSCKIFKVEGLKEKDSLNLFSWHAFRKDYPYEDFVELAKSAVQHCSGLPLALQVLGASLCGKSKDVWKSALQKLETFPNQKIDRILRISYESLEDEHDRNLFLDITCFFIGKDKDYAARILKSCDFHPIIGIDNLIEQCLLTINRENKLVMHQLVMDMGREIVREESSIDLGKRSRLWYFKDAFHVLRNNLGTRKVRGLILDSRKLVKEKKGQILVMENHEDQQDQYSNPFMEKLKAAKQYNLGFFNWPRRQVDGFPNELMLETEALAKLQRLRYLHLDYTRFHGSYEEFPRMLKWLSWRGFPLEFLPPDLCIKGLIALDLRNSNLKHNWKGGKHFEELKFLNLSHCHDIERTPDVIGLPSLEKLILKGCINLVEVDESISYLQRLVSLNMKDCKSLHHLPNNIHMLKSLEELLLSGCSRLSTLPEVIKKMESLRVLHIDGTDLYSQKESKSLSIRRSNHHLWEWIIRPLQSVQKHKGLNRFGLDYLPSSLVTLNVANCKISDVAFLDDLHCLPCLKRLNMSGNPVQRLPESIKSLTLLDELLLDECGKLECLPELPLSLKKVNAEGCTSLRKIMNLPNFFKGLKYIFHGCENLTEIQGLFKLKVITDADVQIIKNLGLFHLQNSENREVNVTNAFTEKQRKAPLQILHECGIFSVYIKGNDFPDWYTYQGKGSSLSFIVPLHPHLKIAGFNVCISYSLWKSLESTVYWVRIQNVTKGVSWSYVPSVYAAPSQDEDNDDDGDGDNESDLMWLSHWKCRDQLESGDEVTVAMSMSQNSRVKRCGVHLVYESNDGVDQSDNEVDERNSEERGEDDEGFWDQSVSLCDEDLTAYRRGSSQYLMLNRGAYQAMFFMIKFIGAFSSRR